jgi:DNA-directed RNA polymerase specialized sigma24 family protein
MQPSDSGPYDNDLSITLALESLDAYIRDLARKFFPQTVAHPDVLDLEIDELVQKVRIKLWSVLRKRSVSHLRAYVRCIVQTEAIDMLRRHKATLSLSMSNDGELHQGTVLMSYSEGMQDPLYEIEQEEAMTEYVRRTANALLTLPPGQRHALICALKDRLDDLNGLLDALREREINIEQVHWPEDKKALQSYRTSLSLARSKLRVSLSSYSAKEER